MLGDFTKEEAQETVDSVTEIWKMLSKNKQKATVGFLNQVYLFLEAAKQMAPTEAQWQEARRVQADHVNATTP